MSPEAQAFIVFSLGMLVHFPKKERT
jgi:hypothetical protein